MSPERFDQDLFDHLLSLLISPEERYALTLRFLVSKNSQKSIGYLFKLGRSTANGIFDEIYEKLWLEPANYVKAPTSVDDWKNISSDLLELWDMPHCFGALDWKFVNQLFQVHYGTTR